jgi:protein kinase-like protein
VTPRADDDFTIGETTTARTPGTKRFATGSIVAGRYRLVALLGRGGMGEVYRAEDLTLDQPVALKFLPDAVVGDASRLTQFHNELRVARQVSHKNVVRLYDLGEADGRPFLTMEYVDGEDLASLLRRIGRFPQDKAIDIARQICAGVAAAHERGVIHRDLKPANVMLDGEGNVRITDFGIATALRQGSGQAGDGTAGLVGTPQYMAPEMLTGSSASTKTDIYALGLILFEVFTGRRAYDAKTLGELKQQHDTQTVATPSSIVRDLEPAIERVILRAIDRDPARRPGSALAIAAALPGGDPLAEALAAGETPSPDMLVAAGETDAVPVRQGLLWVGAFVASLVAYAWLSPMATLADLVPLDKPPAVLADRAQQITRAFGYSDAPADTAESFAANGDYVRWLVQRDQSTNRWNPAQVSQGPAVLYWRRASPVDLDPLRPALTVSPTDPPMTTTGMSLVILDTQGRLQEFHRVPPQRDPPAPSRIEGPPWAAVFDAAGLPMAAFTPVEPEWTPRDFADTRRAWRGPLPGSPDIDVRVEAASYRDTIVSFHLVGPWSRASRMEPMAQSALNRALAAFSTLLWISVLAGAVFLARKNLCEQRADRRSATRLAMSLIVMQAAAWLFASHHGASVGAGLQSFLKTLSTGLLGAAIWWMLYLALEPYGRRFWPDGLLGWTRLWSGRMRDPRIGREILIGSALGGALMLIDLFRATAPRWIGRPPGIPSLGEHVEALTGPTPLVATWTQQVYNSVQTALLVVMLIIVLRLVVRRTWAAVAIGLIIVAASAGANMPTGDVLWISAVAQLAAIGVIMLAIFRYGLLVTAVTLIVDNIPTSVPIVSHPAWAATPGNLSIAFVVALACFGYYAARSGQPLFGTFE